MSTYETLSLMIAFGVLVVMIIGTKKIVTRLPEQ
ncbi:MAG: putative holin-like toxin [Hungatella hathewayi]|nr:MULTISPECIES: putative holin-like toxin [Hungatella]MDY6235470.1 putative holin-like toxin [Hungatella hathewayi]